MKIMTHSVHVLTSLAIVVMSLGAALAAEKRPVVVELFTSQGCSSCPPANANLIKLSKRPDVLTLSFAVTYWDYLGWKDSFGKSEFTERQAVYEPALGESGPFTPQMVINGRASTIGNQLSQVESLIAAADNASAPSIDLTQEHVTIGSGTPPARSADVWLVRYDPKTVLVPVRRGENAGATLPHGHVVHSLERLGSWNGQVLSLDVPRQPVGLRTAVLVQVSQGGPILTAATN